MLPLVGKPVTVPEAVANEPRKRLSVPAEVPAIRTYSEAPASFQLKVTEVLDKVLPLVGLVIPEVAAV